MTIHFKKRKIIAARAKEYSFSLVGGSRSGERRMDFIGKNSDLFIAPEQRAQSEAGIWNNFEVLLEKLSGWWIHTLRCQGQKKIQFEKGNQRFNLRYIEFRITSRLAIQAENRIWGLLPKILCTGPDWEFSVEKKWIKSYRQKDQRRNRNCLHNMLIILHPIYPAHHGFFPISQK